MSFLSNLFKGKKEKTPPTRQDMEDNLYVHYIGYMPVNTGRGVLQQAFQNYRPAKENEKKLLSEVFDIISSVPAGKKLIDNVAAQGFKFYFNDFRGEMDGCMFAEYKTIMLCPRQHSSAAAVAATAFHEMVHAVQNYKSGQLLHDSTDINIADQFRFQRAAEAAAWTEEANFAYQIKDKHPEVLSHVTQFPMYHAFSDEMEKSGDIKKAGEVAFKSWYGFKHYQKFYKKQHVQNISCGIAQNKTNKNKLGLSQSLEAANILQNVFVSEDLRANISADYLSQPAAFSLSSEAVKKLDECMQSYTEGFKKGINDRSYHKMYSYENGKTYADMEQTSRPVAASLHVSHDRPSRMSSLKKTAGNQQKQQIIRALRQSGANR